MPESHEELGRVVRETWVAWAREQPDCKPSWLVPWDELDAGQREVDMRIGAGVVKALRGQGYMVVKIPPCTRAGRGHGRHILITRSATCPGEDPMPHGVQGCHDGTFGVWVHCACGHSFRDYTAGDEPATPWQGHKAEHIGERTG